VGECNWFSQAGKTFVTFVGENNFQDGETKWGKIAHSQSLYPVPAPDWNTDLI